MSTNVNPILIYVLRILQSKKKNKIKLQPVPPSMPSEALSVLFLDIHRPPVALTEAQVVILYFFILEYIQ